MDNDKLLLKDGTEITLKSSMGIGALYVQTENIDAACALWKKFTKKNLKQVNVKNADGLTVGNYTNMVLDHFEGKENADGTMLVTFSLREKSALELMDERLSNVEAGQVTQDSGIDELGQVMSDLMEGGGQ